MIRDPAEIHHALATEDDVTVHLHASPHQAMAFLQPFWEMQSFRQRLGYETYLSLSQPFSLAYDLLPKHNRPPVEKPEGKIVAIYANDVHGPLLHDYRRQLGTPGKAHRNTLFPLETFAAISQTMAARCAQPWLPITHDSMPMRILFLPLSTGSTAESIFGSFPLYRELCSSLLLAANQLKAQPIALDDHHGQFFDFSSSALFIDSTIYQSIAHSMRDLVMAILSSTLVVAMESEYAALSAMLSVPTLTIYGSERRMLQQELAEKSLPVWSSSLEHDPSKVTPSYVFSKLSQIQSTLYSVY